MTTPNETEKPDVVNQDVFGGKEKITPKAELVRIAIDACEDAYTSMQNAMRQMDAALDALDQSFFRKD